VLVIAVDAQAFGRLNRVPIREGNRSEAVMALAHGDAWISETLANPLDLTVGSTVTLPGEGAAFPLQVAAVVQNYSTPSGMIYLDHATFRHVFGDIPTRQVAIWLKPGVPIAEATQAVVAVAGSGVLQVVSNRDIRDSAQRVFERTFAITHLMTGLSALVAFIAVISASAALLDERRSLFGYLRAIGFSRRGLEVAMAIEAGLLAVVSTLVSWGVGYFVSAILVFVVNRRAFGWTLQFLPGQGNYLVLLGWALAAALLGVVVPIHRMRRSPILSAIREE
jgi:putative ABC transport system permease protein